MSRAVLSGGAVLAGIGAAYFVFSGYALDTTISTAAGDMANLQLMHVQSINFAAGIGLAIIAALLFVGAAIVEALRPDD